MLAGISSSAEAVLGREDGGYIHAFLQHYVKDVPSTGHCNAVCGQQVAVFQFDINLVANNSGMIAKQGYPLLFKDGKIVAAALVAVLKAFVRCTGGQDCHKGQGQG